MFCVMLHRGKAEDAGNWRIVLGKHKLKKSEAVERVFPVKRIYRHEHFNYPVHSELDYDIALVKAGTDILPNNFIRYACLPRLQTILKPGHFCWVTGWGDTRGTWPFVFYCQNIKGGFFFYLARFHIEQKILMLHIIRVSALLILSRVYFVYIRWKR